MTVDTVINKTLAYLRSIGYVASDKPQEKPGNRQVTVILEDIDVEPESPVTYFMEVTLSINYYSNEPQDIIDKFKTLPFNIEVALRDDTSLADLLVVEIGSPSIELNGRAYYLSIPLTYKELIRV